MWGGRFEEPPAEAARAFTRSFPVDRRLYREDIVASIAHAGMLGARKIIPAADSEAVVQALERLLVELDAAGGPPDEGDEDIHSYIERVLIERLGDPGRRLHTARSRNDQVATDMRLYCKGLSLRTAARVLDLLDVLVTRAQAEAETLLPGMTHLQIGQPITLGHYLLGIGEMLKRDVIGFLSAFSIADVSPLGSGAVAGVPYPIDRRAAAARLGFAEISRNSVDAVADRDFVIAVLQVLSGLMGHLSRWSEDLVIWASPAFAMVEFDEAYATGSSLMPQKKNPDVAELVRGKAGSVQGILTGLAATVKSVPLSYGLDLQEDKQAVFGAEDHVMPALRALRGAFETLTFDRARMRQLAGEGYAGATEIADYLVARGAPFRTAHEIAGNLVRQAIASGRRLEELSDEEWRQADERLGGDMRTRLAPEESVARRNVEGGTAPERVRAESAEARAWIELQRGRIGELWAHGMPERLRPAASG